MTSRSWVSQWASVQANQSGEECCLPSRFVGLSPPTVACSFLLVFLFVIGYSVFAQEGLPLYEQEAYDLIILTPETGGKTLQVLPLPFPQRRVPQPLPRTGNLQFRLVDRPDILYEVPWAAVAEIRLFHDLVLAKAQELVDAGQFEDAYGYFAYLLQNDPQLPGLSESFDTFLFKEASWHQSQGRHERAIAILGTLYGRRKDYPGLSEALGQSFQQKFQTHVSAKNYAAARACLDALKSFFADHPVVTNGRQELIRLATEQLEEARRQAAEGNFSLAHRSARAALGIWPDLKEAADLSLELQRKYPRVVVGVTQSLPWEEPQPFYDWASRRVVRLVARGLFEFAGPSLEGGRYVCPFGEAEWDRSALRLTVKIRPGIRLPQPSGEELTAWWIVSCLTEETTQARSSGNLADWRKLLKRINFVDPYTFTFEFAQPVLRPEALLARPVEFITPATVDGTIPTLAAGELASASGDGSGLTGNGSKDVLPGWTTRYWLGPYRLIGVSEREAFFQQVPGYFAASDGGPPEIVEMRFSSAAAAAQALRSGEVDIVDRIPPWMVQELREIPVIKVDAYRLPLVHCLIPNRGKPLLRRSVFRRALLYGIDRQAILARLMGRTKDSACQVISGPFLATSGSSDPLDYAYDSAIEPKPYDPQLAIAMVQVAFTDWQSEFPEKNRPTAIPPLVLAHVPGPVAEVACQAIAQYWRRLGLKVQVEVLEKGPLRQLPEHVDFFYAELAVWEPVVDAHRIFGRGGLIEVPSPYLAQAVFRLDDLRDWSETAAQLRRIHRLVDQQMPILPLWQMVDYFAVAAGLEGIGPRPLTLYQNVENWRPIVR